MACARCARPACPQTLHTLVTCTAWARLCECSFCLACGCRQQAWGRSSRVGPAYQGPSLLTLVKYTQAILKALAHTHSRSVLHRGLTPDHVLVGSMLQSMPIRRRQALLVAPVPKMHTQVQAKPSTCVCFVCCTNVSSVVLPSMPQDSDDGVDSVPNRLYTCSQ